MVTDFRISTALPVAEDKEKRRRRKNRESSELLPFPFLQI